MSGVPVNILQQVELYAEAGLGYLVNQSPFFKIANMKFEHFNMLPGNLGASITYRKPYRFVSYDSLTITAQSTQQYIGTLTANKTKNIAPAFTAEQFILNVEDYMDEIGMGAIEELGTEIESDIARSALQTYRFYGDGTTAINSRTQLASALAYFRNYGAANNNTCGVISDIAQADIVGNDLSKFVLNRNEVIANSWEMGNFDRCDWYASNLLPTHTAGYAGQNNKTLTFASINAAGDEITFTVADNETDYVVENDLLYFNTSVRYLTWIGHKPSQNQVQVRVTAASDSAAGSVTVSVFPALLYSAGNTNPNANLTRALTTSDTAKVIPSHRAGIIMSGKPLFVGMPKLPDERPYDTSSQSDPTTGVSLRMYYGCRFGENFHALVHDALWGWDLAPEYAMRLVFPL